MIEKTEQQTQAGARTPFAARAALIAVSTLGVLIATILLVAGAPYLFKGATLESEIARQLRATTGFKLASSGHSRFLLLPRPHVVMDGLHVTDTGGGVTLDAAALDGDVRFLPLVVGRIELSSIVLTRPRLKIDLDNGTIGSDSVIGHAIHDDEPARGGQPLGIVTLVDGSATIEGGSGTRWPTMQALDVTLDWRDLESPATLTGSLRVRDVPTQIAAWIAQPSSLMRGDHSAVALHVRAAPIDLSSDGDLDAGRSAFRGHVSAKAASTMRLLDLFGNDAAPLAPLANVTLDSDVNAVVDARGPPSIDLPTLTLHADGNEYEGTLALQGGARPTLSGTLATEQLTLAPFLERLPRLVENHRWSTAPIIDRQPESLDLDLRVSATHLRLPPFTIDDAALAVMTRNDRTEIALAEGKAYGGAVRGRLSIGISYDDVSVRGTGSIADADASALTWDAAGRQLAAGTLAGSINLETNGNSPASLAANVRGSIKTSVADGEISGIDLGAALLEAARNRPDGIALALHGGRTPFKTLSLAAQLLQGVATFENSAMSAPDLAVAIGGNADIGERRLGLTAMVTAPSQGAPRTGKPPELRLDVAGPFEAPSVRPGRPAATPLR